ncbi:MAG: hypothetical protein AAF737_08210 [Pseudomonadota bacterium]
MPRVASHSSRVKCLIVLACAPLLSACLSSGNGSSALGLQERRPVAVDAAFLAALSPGIIPPANFEGLSRKGKSAALSAEFRALEETPVNVAVEWADGSSAAGQVRASTPYRVGSTTCRPYSHSGTIDGRSFAAKGTACRAASGIWEPIS